MSFELELGADLDRLLGGLRQATESVARLRIAGKQAGQDIQAGFSKTVAEVIKVDTGMRKAGDSIATVATGIAAIGSGANIADAVTDQEQFNDTLSQTIIQLNALSAAEIKEAVRFTDFTNKKHVALQNQIANLQKIQQLSRSAVGTESQQEVIRVLSEQVAKAKELRTEIETPFAGDPVGNTTNAYKSLVTQIRQGTAELAQARIQFGANSDEATKLAARVGDLQRQLRGAREQVAAFDPERRFNALSQSVQGVVGGFTALQGAMTFLGVRSETAAIQLARIQGLLAFSQGINQLLSLGGAFRNLLAALGVTTTAATGTAAALRAVSVALITNPITFAIAALVGLVAAMKFANDGLNEFAESFKGQSEEARKSKESIEKLRLEYQNTTGAINDLDLALKQADLDAESKKRDLLAKAQTEAAESAVKWYDGILLVMGATDRFATVAGRYKDALKEGVDKQKESRKAIDDETAAIKANAIARESARISQTIFTESLERNELAAKGDIALLRVRLSNIQREQERELKQTEGNELKKQEIIIRFANERKKIEAELFAAITKRGEELLAAQRSLIERAQAAELALLTGEDRINREKEIGLKEIQEVQRNLQIKIRLNAEADKQIADQKLTRLLQIPEVVRTDTQKAEIESLIAQVKLAANELALIDLLLIANTRVANDRLAALNEERVKTRISLIRDEQDRAVEEFLNTFKEREAKIREALKDSGLDEQQITIAVEQQKNEGTDAIKTKFRNEDLQKEFEYQVNLINAKKTGADQEIKNETERQIKLAELKLVNLESERVNLDITTEEGERRRAAIAAETREIEDKVAGLKASLKSNQITWADIFNFEGEPEELAAFNRAMDFAVGRVKELGLQILNSLEQANALTISQSEQQLSLIQDAITEKESQIAQEEELNKQGLANNLDIRKQELAALKAQKEQERKELIKSYQEQQKLARARIILEGIESASALVTAAANIFRSFSTIPFGIGIAIAGGVIAGMIGLFLSLKSKIQAATAAPAIGEEGGQIVDGSLVSPRRIVRGKRHSHPSKGMRIEGTGILVEDGEEFFSRKKVIRYNELMNAIQRDDFSMISGEQLSKLPRIELNSKELVRFSETKNYIRNHETLQAISIYNAGVEKRLDKVNENISALGEKLTGAESMWLENDGSKHVKKGKVTSIIKN